jgi:hypothetical protein
MAQGDLEVRTVELDDVLRRRESLMQKRNETDDSTEAEKLGAEIAIINTQLLPNLQKRISDARNRSKKHSDRKVLKRLHGRIAGAISGICYERESDTSERYEKELLEDLQKAKTNSQRYRITKKLERLRRDRALRASLQASSKAS